MQFEFQWKTGSSATGNCPARYRVTSAEGGYIIQGRQLGPGDLAKLRDLGDGETGVWVPADVIEGLGKPA